MNDDGNITGDLHVKPTT